MVMMVTSHNPYWNNSIASCENKIELEPELHHYVLMSTVILNIILRNVLRHVNPWLIHVNVWQKPLQYCKAISLQLIKINGKKKKKYIEGDNLCKKKM